IDMESGALARSGRLAGCLRAISDTPSRPLGPLTELMDANGKLRPAGIARALAAPRRTARALANIRRALQALQQVVTRPDGVVACRPRTDTRRSCSPPRARSAPAWTGRSRSSRCS